MISKQSEHQGAAERASMSVASSDARYVTRMAREAHAPSAEVKDPRRIDTISSS